MDWNRMLMYALVMILGIFLFGIMMSHPIDTSTWTFTGHNEVVDILPIIPYLFLVSLICVPVYFIVQGAKD